MQSLSSPLTTQEWIIDLFSSRAAATGGVVRRKKRDIERYVGMEEFKAELRRRGFHAIENAGQIVIFATRKLSAQFCSRFLSKKTLGNFESFRFARPPTRQKSYRYSHPKPR